MCRAAIAIFLALAACAQDQYQAARSEMVREHIESRGIRRAEVLRAMRTIPRHLFLPADMRPLAYADRPAPIGYGQTISQPYIVALMTELLEPARKHKVLEIGTGSGYQAAVLSMIADRVYSMEIVPELARASAALLKELGYDNVTVRLGDGYKGWPEEAPFDRIILTAAPPEIPQALLDQLKPGGRLVAPEGPTPYTQELMVVDKGKDGKLKKRSALPVIFVPMAPGRD